MREIERKTDRSTDRERKTDRVTDRQAERETARDKHPKRQRGRLFSPVLLDSALSTPLCSYRRRSFSAATTGALLFYFPRRRRRRVEGRRLCLRGESTAPSKDEKAVHRSVETVVVVVVVVVVAVVVDRATESNALPFPDESEAQSDGREPAVGASGDNE